jgi:hypothetical protein
MKQSRRESMIRAQASDQLSGAELRCVSPAALSHGIVTTPMDEFVLWTGGSYGSKAGSRSIQILGLVREAWSPTPLRDLILRAARLDGDMGFSPVDVRDAVRQHQRAKGCCYFWVRGSLRAGFVLVTDVPYPAIGGGPWAKGQRVAPGLRASYPAT